MFEQTSLFVHANAAPRTIYIRMYMHTHTHTHKLSLSHTHTQTTHIHTYTCVCVCVCTRREKANEKGMEACLIWHGSMSYLANRWQTVGKPRQIHTIVVVFTSQNSGSAYLPTNFVEREREREREEGREGEFAEIRSMREEADLEFYVCFFLISCLFLFYGFIL